jgi:hypothetical protein
LLSSKLNGGEVNPAKKQEDVIKKAFPLAVDNSTDDDNKELSPTHYPHVKYWLKATFTSASTTGAMRRHQYLEDSEGQTITADRLGDIRRELSNSLKLIKDEAPSLLADTWTICPWDLQAACCSHMRRSFEEFRYCAKNWKFRSLMTDWYPNFRRNRRQANNIKEEDEDLDISAVAQGKRAAIPVGPRKKAKVVDRVLDVDDDDDDIPNMIINPLFV